MAIYATTLCLSVITTASYFVWIAYIMKRGPGLSSMQVLAFSHLLAAVILVCLPATRPMMVFANPSLCVSIAMIGLLMWLARMLYYYAYSKADVGEVAIFSSFTPVFSLFFSAAAGYAISLQTIAGIVLISASVYFYFSSQYDSVSSHLLRPFVTIFRSVPLRCALLSTLPPAWAIVFHKQAVGLSDPFTVSFWICIIVGTLAGLTIAIFPSRAAAVTRTNALHLLVAGGLQAAMVVSISYFLQVAHPSAAQALLRLAVLLQILMAYVFLHERFHVKRHIFSGILALTGGYLILGGDAH